MDIISARSKSRREYLEGRKSRQEVAMESPWERSWALVRDYSELGPNLSEQVLHYLRALLVFLNGEPLNVSGSRYRITFF